MENVRRYLEVCQQAVHEAGDVLRRMLGHVEAREKGPSDLVTEADFAAQEVVRKIVLGVYPDHALLGEEDPAAPRGPSDGYRWIVDPLDGTTNYFHGIPFFSVSVALEYRGELLVGAIFDPISRECFTAMRGGGAWLGSQRLKTSTIETLSGAVAGAGLPAQAHRNHPDVAVFLEAMAQCQSLRRMGSAALSLAFVAAGRMDIFWSFSTKVWDIAAGALLVQEAGGEISHPSGEPFSLDRPQFVASANPSIHRAFLELIGQSR